MQPQNDDGCGQLRPSVAGGDEGVRLLLGLQLQANDHRAVLLAPDSRARLFIHPDDFRGFDEGETSALACQRAVLTVELLLELSLDDGGWADELNGVRGLEL